MRTIGYTIGEVIVVARTANLHIRVEPDIKVSAEKLFAHWGITVSDAVNMFLHESLMAGGLPFDMRQRRYNAETEAAMQEVRDIAAGKIVAKVYHSIEEMNADLDAEDDAEC